MRKLFILLALLLAVSVSTRAQYGAIHVYPVEEYENQTDKTILMSVWKGDSLVAQKITNPTDVTIIDSLIPGTYKVDIYINNNLRKTYHNLEIIEGQYTHVSIYNLEPYFTNICDTPSPDIFEVSIPVMLGYSLPGSVVHYPTGTSFSFGVRQLFFSGSKHFQWAPVTGLDIGYTKIPEDTTFTPSLFGAKKRERYFNVSVPIGIMFRFTAYNAWSKKNGFKIDAGVLYNVPLYFRNVWIDYNNAKVSNRYIHKYNEINVVARIAVGAFGIQAEYCITDYLKRPYVEPPKLKLGLCFNIKAD